MIDSQITNFLNENGYSDNAKIDPINNSASQRRYYRVREGDKSCILTQSNNIAENKTFLYYTDAFEKVPLNVPKIYAVSEDESMYLQEDLGDKNFLSLLENENQNDEKLVEKIMSDLAKMQVQLPKYIDFSKSYEFQNFDEKIILNDLFYFKNYFLEYLEIPFQKQKLIEDFYKIAEQAENLPHHYFMYRDFQSRNIMIDQDQPYYIDYQGGLQGIAAYDCVSFSWQAKANFTAGQKEEIKNLYFKNMQSLDTISTEDLEKSYQLSLVLRLFQLLGAYGFRGLVQGKPHFVESIKNALGNIQYLVKENLLVEYPELRSVSESSLTPEKINI